MNIRHIIIEGALRHAQSQASAESKYYQTLLDDEKYHQKAWDSSGAYWEGYKRGVADTTKAFTEEKD
jgi:hypothetical protein